MCRRCGERDKRGSNRDRRARKQWLLDEYGDGKTVQCWLKLADDCPGTLTFHTLQVDRMLPGGAPYFGTYQRSNIQPACGPCNRARTALDYAIKDGCVFG